MAEIIFLPVCSNCKSILWGEEINVNTVYNSVCLGNGKVLSIPEPIVSPYVCKYCGSVFQSVNTPTPSIFPLKIKSEEEA